MLSLPPGGTVALLWELSPSWQPIRETGRQINRCLTAVNSMLCDPYPPGTWCMSFHRHSSHNVVAQWRKDSVLNTEWMAGGEAGPGRRCAVPCRVASEKRPYDDCFERQPGTSLLSDEWLPLDSDSSRLKCEHRSGISCWFPLTASFIKLWKGKRNQKEHQSLQSGRFLI